MLPSNYWALAGRGKYEIKPIRLSYVHSQVLRALGIYEEISFDPRTYMELVGPKMGLLQLLENLHLWAPNHVYILFWLGFLNWRIVWPFKC